MARYLHFRTIWISDLHLGTRGCQAEMLLEFLARTHCDNLYLVGDIIDGWRLKHRPYWEASHHQVVQAILGKAITGTRVVYIPGNHDELMRDYIDTSLGDISIVRDDIHETADGRRLLVLHGDEFDAVVRYARWLAMLGDWAYEMALHMNTAVNRFRRLLGLPYWSLSALLKHKVKNAVQFISSFENAVAEAARRQDVQGVVCGHIHTAAMRQIGDILYCNDGDWVESCTALVEDFEGELRVLHWAEERRSAIQAPPALVEQAA